MQSHLLKTTLALALTAALSLPAQALEVEEAGVEKGEAELAYEGTYTDDNGEGAYEHEHEIEGEIGLLDWLKLGVGFGFEEEEGERDFEFSEIEASATVELVDPEQGNFGFALYGRLSKELAEEADESDLSQYAIGVIAETTVNNILFRGNLFYIADLQGNDEQQFDGVEYAYRISYQLNDSFGLGVEGYGTDTDFDDPGEDDANTHMVGPVLYYSRELEERGAEEGSLKDNDDGEEEEGTEMEAQFGVLFGTNDETPDVTLKWNLGLEF